MQLDFICRLEQNFIGRRNFESFQRGRPGRIGWQASGDPVTQNLIFFGIFFEPLAAFVRDLRGGLEEEEALVRVFRIRAATKRVARQGLVIPFRVFATE